MDKWEAEIDLENTPGGVVLSTLKGSSYLEKKLMIKIQWLAMNEIRTNIRLEIRRIKQCFCKQSYCFTKLIFYIHDLISLVI